MRWTQVKGGQEKAFQVAGNGHAKVLWQERAWGVPGRNSREKGRGREMGLGGQGPDHTGLVASGRSLHWTLASRRHHFSEGSGGQGRKYVN